MKILERAIEKLDLDAFRNAWLSNKPLLQMVREFKICGTKQVKKIAEFIGLPKRPEHKTKFNEFADQFAVLHNQGTPYSEIAKILGVNMLTLQHWRKKLDLQSRRKGGFQVLKTKQTFKAVEDYVIHNKAVLIDDAVKDLSLSREKINNIRKQSSILDEFLLYFLVLVVYTTKHQIFIMTIRAT